MHMLIGWYLLLSLHIRILVGSVVKNPPAMQVIPDPSVRKTPWRRKWQPTPIFLHGKFHGQRSLGATVQGIIRFRHNLVTKPT